MSGCLDVQLIVDEISKDTSENMEQFGKPQLKRLCKVAGLLNEDIEMVVEQYSIFKTRLSSIIGDDSVGSIKHNYGSILFKTHQCSKDCKLVDGKCPSLKEVIMSLKVNNMKLLHLFLKEESLSAGIGKFLCLFLQCAVKTHAEGVAESMGSYVDIHSDKRRGLDVAVVGIESCIHWNGPPVHLADNIGVASLDSYFAGRSDWRFVTKKNKLESVVVSRLKSMKAKSKLFD